MVGRSKRWSLLLSFQKPELVSTTIVELILRWPIRLDMERKCNVAMISKNLQAINLRFVYSCEYFLHSDVLKSARKIQENSMQSYPFGYGKRIIKVVILHCKTEKH